MIYDMTTSNEYFIKMSLFLKKQRIKNNNFFLALLDEDLIGINPRDPNLDTEQKRKILAECKNNYWYFLREIVKVPSVDNDEGEQYPLNRGLLAFNYCLCNNISTMVDLPNHVGKYLTVDIRLLWEYLMCTESKAVLFDRKHDDTLQHLNGRIKPLYRLLPDYMRVKDICEDKTKFIRSGDSCIEVGKKAKSIQSADIIGRSLTYNRQVFCDFSDLEYNKNIFFASRPPYTLSSVLASDNNTPYGTILLSNGGNLGKKSGKFAYELKEQLYKFDEKFYDLSIDQLISIIESNSSHSMLYISYTILELSKSDDWITRRLRMLNYNWQEFMRDAFITYSE